METVEKFALNENHFLFFQETVLSMGYVKNTKFNSAKLFERLNLIPPRKIVGREVSFIYKSSMAGNNFTVILHTTYREDIKKWRDTGTDVGWCLIVDGDKAKYFAKPFSRTKGFVLKFLRYAWVTKWKVDHRPLCRECHDLMDIYKNVQPRKYYWICRNSKRHANNTSIFEGWDIGLPLKASEFVAVRRAYTAKYHKKLKDEGKIVTPARKIRNPWVVKNPQNLH